MIGTLIGINTHYQTDVFKLILRAETVGASLIVIPESGATTVNTRHLYTYTYT